MHIKTITISGFRSYRETNHLSDLSAGINAVVGANGCGKTNILNAIQFILSDEYNGLKADQRQQLINESKSQRLLMAYVEIVIDNTDRRIPLDQNEIRFRRQIGLKKDQYFMNGKIITHSDIVSLLETAGFSRSNPYYIVKQGKVNEMAIASDALRLQVMREVAGTRIYDERKAEALKMLKDCNQRSEKIDECIIALEDRLSNLMIEGHDLKNYLKWDKRRRLLEYIIANKESEDIKNKILKMEDKLEQERQKLDSKRSKLQDIQKTSKENDRKLKVITAVLQEYRKDMSYLTKKINDLNEEKAKIESKVHDFQEKLNYEKENDQKIKDQLKEINRSIDKQKKKLFFVTAKFEDLENKETKLISELKAKQSRKADLYSKTKRKDSFATVEKRNEWLESEIKKLDKDINSYVKRIDDLKKEDSDIHDQKIQLENEQKGFAEEEAKLLKTMQEEKENLCDLNKQIKEMETQRSEVWKTENTLKEEELKLNEQRVKLENRLNKICGPSAIIGRESVRRVLKSYEERASDSEEEEIRLRPIIDGYLGVVIDCIEFDSKLNKAIEVTAKTKLFNHIVTTDRIATKIMNELNRQRMPGEFNFIAINKLKTKQTRYPDMNNNARPLSSMIRFDDKYKIVAKYLFDRTLICRNSEFASFFARSSKLDCVTLEGDFVSHTGLMSGGYYGSDSRVPLFKAWKTVVENIKEIGLKADDCSKRKEINEKDLAVAQSSLANLDIRHTKTKRKVENHKTSKDLIRHKLNDLNKKQESIRKSIVNLETTLPSIRASKESFKSELELGFDSQLSNDEQQELNQISKDTDKLKTELRALNERQNKLQTEKSAIESDLERNLMRRKFELERALIDSKVAQDETTIETDSLDTLEIDRQIDSLRKEAEEKNKKIDEFVEKVNDQKDLIDKLKKEEDEQMDAITTESKMSRKIAVKLDNLQKKNEDYQKKLRNLGTIPTDSGNIYKDMSLKENYRELQLCKRELSELPNVNQKALDQLADGENKSQALISERENQKLSLTAIERLIEDLENQKYEAIQFTYKQVAKFFSEVFKKLVPEGSAFLDMIYADTNGTVSSQSTQSQASTQSQSSGGISGNEPSYARIDNFIGVKIRVAFTGRTTTKELNELSGGQKSIVALAFIFAIQKCDPAPFYLFDEVDHALDPTYRTALSEIIKELSKNSQFIITTFRPELLERADKFFGVKLRNRISHVEEITKEVATDFVQSDDGSKQISR